MTKQLVSANVNIVEIAGWCLRYTDRAFGLKAVYGTAWEAWLATKFKHQDRNFPAGVAVPVWFDWTGDVGSGRKQYGHAAVRTADGKIYSSPLKGTGRVWFNSVDDLAAAFGGGMKYVGWSEDLSNVKVIELGEEMPAITREQIQWHYRLIAGAEATEQEIRNYVGKDYYTVTEEIKRFFANEGRGYNVYKLAAEKQIAELKQNTSAVVPQGQSDGDKKLAALATALKDVLDIN